MFVSIFKVQRVLIEGGARLISYSQSLQGSQSEERAILQRQDLVVTQNPTRSQEIFWLIEHDNSTDLKHVIIISDSSGKYSSQNPLLHLHFPIVAVNKDYHFLKCIVSSLLNKNTVKKYARKLILTPA